jgi:bisphosphoglycerate-independent phosphoglycerate mutase (AlkP superfamily)
VQVVGEVAGVPEQLHDAVGETERSLAGDRLVHCVNTAAGHLPWVADHGIQEEVLEDERECEKAEVEHEGRCVVEEDHDS